MARQLRFTRALLAGHPGDVARAVRRVIVRGVNHGLVVTSTTDGGHAATSWHFKRPPRNFLGRAVDMAGPGQEAERAFQRDLIETHGAHSFHEVFGPDNEWNVKNGVIVGLGEGTPLETAHDTHIHIAPRLVIPLPTPLRREIEETKRRRRLRRNKRIARANGAHFVTLIFDSAHKHNVSVPLALALFEQETGFENEYGHDRTAPGRPPIWHGKEGKVLVTEDNYKTGYLPFRRRTNLAQGVGPGQLTSPGFQDLADRRGGCWKPEVNIDVSLEILAGHITALGTFNGIGAYNGGRGDPNETYARSVLALRDRWSERLT
jgi:hypothetical protein